MKEECSIGLIIATLAAVCTIIAFVTGKSLPGITSGDDTTEATSGLIEGTTLGQTEGDEITVFIKKYDLDATVMCFPVIEENIFLLGGTWRFTGIDKDISLFSATVSVFSSDDSFEPIYGQVYYGTCWNENKNEDVNYTLVSDQPDNVAFGTFVVDMSDSNLVLFGDYTCRLKVEINDAHYAIDIPFTIK